MNQVAGLLLAAGAGSRLGTPKALLEVDGQPLVRRGVRVLRLGGCAPVAVVVGAAASRVADATLAVDAEVVHNPAWASGMGSSLRAGLEALAGRAAAVVIALVDQPSVGPEVVRRLQRAWRTGATVAAAAYDGRQGNPVLLDAAVWQAVADRAVGDVGAREFLSDHPDLVTLVACDDVGGPGDIDTPDDLAAWRGEEQPCS
ncbi:MAG: nucleotidyltransferase family protein [Actinomycetota bacterium]|nr:nucleotidyltransferase family protein [Euzebyales bacterium]MDQ3453670.1 nucleotidyltransferase family protein [Actinomycetota bacterium]